MNDQKKRRNQSVSRYEPITAPEKWTGDERRFAIRLTQLMDELYERHAALNRRIAALEAKKE